MAPGSPAAPLRVVLIGITGRMGQALLREAGRFPGLRISGAIASAASTALGTDAAMLAGLPPAGVPVSADLAAALAACDVAVDFSRGEASAAHVEACHSARRPLLLGATGWPDSLNAALNEAARDIALLVAANTSLGVTLLTELTRLAAHALPPSFDIDVLERHHRGKADAPSGTALALGRAAAAGRGVPFAPALSAVGPRGEARIGFAAVRAGDRAGEHTVLFSGPGEELALTHRASERAVFARGALAAALWLAVQPPGYYGMADFLGFKTAT
jgi:4-hydroxy-tetrahydrodipicolinate reductase